MARSSSRRQDAKNDTRRQEEGRPWQPWPSSRLGVLQWLDRAALGGIALGFLLVFQPWGGTLRSGFFVTAFATILHIVTSHMEMPDEGPEETPGAE